MNVGQEAERMAELARARTPQGRAKLLLAVADLCESAEAAGSLDPEALHDLLSGILLQLTGQVERDIRRLLSDKLACAEWAPAALVNMLVLDDIEIARPLIACSPVLQDRDLVHVLLTATLDHQMAVATRTGIGPAVADAILDQDEPSVLTALAANATAEISPRGMERLVDASHRVASLRAPLTRHPALQPEQAERLYQWVGRSLRLALCSRFRLDAEKLKAPLAQAMAEAFRGTAAPAAPDAERDEAEQRLIEKLHGAGQLKSGYLLRALREGKLGLFECALAKLGGFSVAQVRRATGAKGAELLALACAAVGLDRSVFPTILDLVRGLTGGLPGGDVAAAVRAAQAFGAHPPHAVAAAFRNAASI